MVRHSLRTGLSFGLTSGIITTLGLMVGLHAFSGSKLVVVGGILTIAIADACSDALDIHLAEEAEFFFYVWKNRYTWDLRDRGHTDTSLTSYPNRQEIVERELAF
jgi:hypothetical protein